MSTSYYSKTSPLPSEAASSEVVPFKETPPEEASSEEIPFKETPPEETPSEEAPSQADDWFLTPKTTVNEVEPARFVSSTHSSTGGRRLSCDGTFSFHSALNTSKTNKSATTLLSLNTAAVFDD